MKLPTFNDKYHREGFPEGWFVQERLDDDVALLCKDITFPFPSGACVCSRPKAITTEEWLPTARMLAEGFELVQSTRPTGGSNHGE